MNSTIFDTNAFNEASFFNSDDCDLSSMILNIKMNHTIDYGFNSTYGLNTYRTNAFSALAYIYSVEAYEALQQMGCDNITQNETVVDLLNDCELTDDFQLDGGGFFYFGYNEKHFPVVYATDGFNSLVFSELGLASHQINFTDYSFTTNSSSHSKIVNVSVAYINFQTYEWFNMDYFKLVCGFHKDKQFDTLLVDYKEYKVNLSGNSVILNTSNTNMSYFSCYLSYDYHSNKTQDYISNYTVSITEIDFNMSSQFNRNATHLNGDIKISFIDWNTCENDSISIASLKCNYFHEIPTNESSFDSVDKININCNGTNVIISTKIMEYSYFSCMLKVNNRTIIHTDKVPPPPNNIKIVPAMTIYEQKERITAYGSVSFKDWSNCESESVKYKLYCNFGSVDEINGTVIKAEGITINCIKTMVPLIETREMSKLYLICQIRDEKDVILANSNVKSKKSPILLFEYTYMKYEIDNDITTAYGDIHYIWSDCEHSSVVVKLYCDFFDRIPSIDDIYTIDREIVCERTSINFNDDKNRPYFGCILKDENLRYSFNYSEIPRFEINDKTNVSYDYSKNEKKFKNNGNIKYEKWLECESKSSLYKLYCSYNQLRDIKVDPSKYVDINCKGNELDLSESIDYRYFVCVITNPKLSDMIVNGYRKEYGSFNSHELQIYTQTSMNNWNSNNNLLVKGVDYVHCNDLTKDDLYYICTSNNNPLTSMGMFDLSKSKKYDCKDIELNEEISNGDRFYGCLIYNKEKETQMEIFALEAPSFEMNEVKLSLNEEGNKNIGKGYIKYKWNDCLNVNKKYYIECKMFENVPKYDEFLHISTTLVNCSGSNIYVESDDIRMKYLGCIMYNSEDYTASSIRYIDLPRMNMRTIQIHPIKPDDKRFIVNGTMLFEWESCSIYESKTELYCIISSEYPRITEIESSKSMEFKCNGNDISTLGYSIDVGHNYFSCITKNKETKEIYSLNIKEHIELEMNNLKIEETVEGKKIINGKINFQFDTCETNDYYKELCIFSNKIDMSEFDYNLGLPLYCNGIEINEIIPESNNEYFLCLVYNEYNPLFDYSFSYISTTAPTSKPHPISSNTIFIIIGTCVGGCLLIVLIGIGIYYCKRNRNIKRSAYDGYSNFI